MSLYDANLGKFMMRISKPIFQCPITALKMVASLPILRHAIAQNAHNIMNNRYFMHSIGCIGGVAGGYGEWPDEVQAGIAAGG
jgi:hypothetical protein